MSPSRCKFDEFLDTYPTEYVVAAARALLEAETPQERADCLEADVGVGATAKELREKLVMASHGGNLSVRLTLGYEGWVPRKCHRGARCRD